MAFLFAYDRKGPTEEDFNLSRVPSRQPSTRTSVAAADSYRESPDDTPDREDISLPDPNKKHIVFPDPVAFK